MDNKFGIIEPQQFNIEEVLLITSDGTGISLKPSMLELAIYEDLFSPALTGHVALTDAAGFIESFNITGFNYINISFSKTSPDDPTQYQKYFRIYKIGKNSQKTRSNEAYVIDFCSEELVLTQQKKVARSFTNRTISDIVTTIVREELKSNKNIDGIERTEGVYNFVIPNKNPFKAISWLSNYAKPAKLGSTYIGADMLFFETRKGYNFRSLQSMYKDPVFAEYHYSPQNVSSDAQQQEDLVYGLKSMLTCRITEHFDTMRGIGRGLFANKIIGVDTLLRQQVVTGFKYDDYINGKLNAQGGNKPITLNPYPLTNNSTNKDGKTVSEMVDSVVKVLVTNGQQRNNPLIKGEPTVVGTIAPTIDAETYIPYRTAQIGLANFIKVEFTIPGDPLLTVGSIVKLNIPSLSISENSNEKRLNKYYSGKYIVSAINHKLDYRGIYVCVVEAITDSLSYPNIAAAQSGAGDIAKGIGPIEGGVTI
jgi:hypothetical protein